MSTAIDPIADAYSNIDPICGMAVKPDSPLRHIHECKTYLFCNPKCLSKFSWPSFRGQVFG